MKLQKKIKMCTILHLSVMAVRRACIAEKAMVEK